MEADANSVLSKAPYKGIENSLLVSQRYNIIYHKFSAVSPMVSLPTSMDL